MVERLFGTDGVRGRAGVPPLDRETVRRLGAALVRALPRSSSEHQLLIGRDTRESGAWLLLAAWLAYSGALLFQFEAQGPGSAICTTPARN